MVNCNMRLTSKLETLAREQRKNLKPSLITAHISLVQGNIAEVYNEKIFARKLSTLRLQLVLLPSVFGNASPVQSVKLHFSRDTAGLASSRFPTFNPVILNR